MTTQITIIIEDHRTLLMWDRTVDTYKTVSHNRPDIILKSKAEKLMYLIDVAVPNSKNMKHTVQHKISKYKELAMEIERQWRTRTKTLPIVVTATGLFPKSTIRNLTELGCTTKEVRAMQKAVVLHTTRTVRKVLGEEAPRL